MSQEITQWLAEIKSLQQQLAEAVRERDAANASAMNWRRLYETEASQRRTELHLAQQTIDHLKADLTRLQDAERFPADPGTELSGLQAEVESFQTAEALKHKLLEVMAERNHLAQALKTEQENHAHTRKGLTTALGDTVDQLARERAKSQSEEA
ncbi:hypothetical protein BST81_07880 [Leptolyngbya sp. 'hensonii']|uniref:hypothetical protein n=1 Tax=Leptolyngbya sp. 'hensonii' TaxID=1922337 RepID=UPI00094F8075|nr:hypothetical protein [Leptolyngbya sp. 'hensonii']OLP19119.1 hypothetical protein BST81_07880 [Leptolyngbya sp. 'hensonii']